MHPTQTARRAVSRRFYGCSPIGIVRRLQGLAAQGHSSQWIAEQLGWTVEDVADARAGDHQPDDIGAHDLHVLCEFVGDRCPVYGRGVAAAGARRGWAPLTAWLPGEIDDPDSAGDLAHARHGSGTAGFDDDEAAWLRKGGATTEEIARRMHVKPDSLERMEERARQGKRNRYSEQQLLSALVRVLSGERQSDVADDTPISRSHLSNILAGRERPKLLAKARELVGSSVQSQRCDAIQTPYHHTTTPQGGTAA